ncbi:MAG: YajQ family cyclic di-GMP-binding protein [Candidatus Omnitrophica bacterium]|nr:YajQ family cyclic di-GMP-binding protein [Candidatus Omnitrophota bacterium]
MPQFSFDIVSKIDLQEVDNAVNQSLKEIHTRFDFKGTKSNLEFIKTEKKIKVLADDDLKLRNLHDILKTRMTARGISVKSMNFKDPERAFEGNLRQEIELIQGIPVEKAKEIVKVIKNSDLKVQAAIQDEQIRVTSKSKDELQAVMQLLKSSSFSVPLQFTNYRS